MMSSGNTTVLGEFAAEVGPIWCVIWRSRIHLGSLEWTESTNRVDRVSSSRFIIEVIVAITKFLLLVREVRSRHERVTDRNIRVSHRCVEWVTTVTPQVHRLLEAFDEREHLLIDQVLLYTHRIQIPTFILEAFRLDPQFDAL